MKGTATALSPTAAEEALALYPGRFGFLSQVPATFDRMSVYLFRPHWARLIDNSADSALLREWA